MIEFRFSIPKRTYAKKELKSYRSYKKYLLSDFSNRCGYCDGSDTWQGGFKSYHIDHFAPKDKFPLLENTYTNLIYACPSCNSSKSNKWPSNDSTINIVNDKGYLNPIDDDLNLHFHRNEEGEIFGLTPIGIDMAGSLKLALERHSIIWKLTKLERLINEFKKEIITSDLKEKENLVNIHYRLLKIFYEYYNRLRNINKQ